MTSAFRVRSYVLRQGRQSDASKRAMVELAPRYAVEYVPRDPGWAARFGRDAPRVLEIGFGMGETTARIAGEHPQVDFIAVDVHGPGVASLLRRIDAMGLSNLLIVQHDAVDVVEHMIAPASLGGIHVYFPDPWPKKRHHKRRLIKPAFLRTLAERLSPGGYLHLATDWPEYAGEMLACCAGEPLLANTAQGFAPRPPWRPLTKFEQRGLKLGHPVNDVLFRRAAVAADATGGP